MIGVRLDEDTERQLDAAAKRLGRTRSEIVRDALRRYLEADASFLAEARRQSLLASGADDAEAAALSLSLADADEAS
ncbi:MAG: ribbon-helix-helix protein, CopG family [Myxococcales bacterium]|nr:ribbon-helix-helix protein, CopG family [Myxococcales bacterium]MCB9731269.1 ribbon-helix-helix protein, CopG family [Deltaproteobacteria bacterium]